MTSFFIKNIAVLFGMLLSASALSGCAYLASEKVSHCYELADDPETIIIITPRGEEFSGPDGESIFYDTILITDQEEGQETLGEIREGSFYYADGSGLAFSENEAKGFGGRIEGMMTTKTTCL